MTTKTSNEQAADASAKGTCDTGTPLEQLKYYRDEAQFAIGQLNTRVGAYLTSQSFLLITLGSVMNNNKREWDGIFSLVMPLLLAAIGLALTLVIRPGIIASLEVIEGWHRRQREVVEKHPELDIYNVNVGQKGGQLELTEDSASHSKSVMYATHVMWVLGSAWVVVSGFAVHLHFAHSS